MPPFRRNFFAESSVARTLLHFIPHILQLSNIICRESVNQQIQQYNPINKIKQKLPPN